MTRISRLLSLLPVAALLLVASPSMAAGWQKGDYGGNLTMTYYVPDNVDANPALVMSLHYCSGSETSGQGWFQQFADKYGFMIISPKSPGNCWDASPGRTGDRAQIAMMIDWAIKEHNVDPTRVFAAGASSGACLSETMLASYPDKIAAASVLAGVPVGFWMGGNECGVCSQQVASTDTAQSWGDKVRNAGPMNFTGSRGRIQLFHAIQDQYLGSGNLAVEVSQWTNALEATGDGQQTADMPRSGWTQTSYKNAAGVVVVQSNWWANSPPMSHDLTSNINPPLWQDVVTFFGLDQDPAPAPSDTGMVSTGGAGGTGNEASGGAPAAGGAGGGPGAPAPGPVPTTTTVMPPPVATTPATSSPAPTPVPGNPAPVGITPPTTPGNTPPATPPATTPAAGTPVSTPPATNPPVGTPGATATTTAPDPSATGSVAATDTGDGGDSGGCQLSGSGASGGFALALLGLALSTAFARRRRA